MKKIAALVLVLGMVAFAQDTYAPEATSVTQQDDISAYTSGAPAPETPVMNINETKSDEPVFFVSFHPLSLAIFSLLDITAFYLTFEGNIASNLGLVVRPLYLDINLDNSNEELDIKEYGAALGARYYFKPMHRGAYIEPRLEYNRVDAKYTRESRYYSDAEDAAVKGFAFSFGALMGYKVTNGHFSMFADTGYEYAIVALTGKDKNDVSESFGVGGGFDFNLGIGFAF